MEHSAEEGDVQSGSGGRQKDKDNVVTITVLRIAVPSPLDRSFDYLLPPQAVNDRPLIPGIRVRVPFGRTHQVGILLEVRRDSDLPLEALRPSLEILDREPLLPPDLMDLARWAQRYYHHPPGEVFSALLPVLLRRGHKARRKVNCLWRLTVAGQQAKDAGTLGRAPRQQALLDYLRRHPDGVSSDHLKRQGGYSQATIRALQGKGWIASVEESWEKSLCQADHRPRLNPAQTEAVTAVRATLETFNVFLLEGVTGSGKTEVYLDIVETVLAAGRQALVLVPEIGLTPQLLARFRQRFGSALAVLHSGLGHGQRLNAWLAARDGRASVVIGTRSAIFAPLRRPGLIVIDEEHDTSFKQQDGFRYSARDLAVVRGRRLNVPVLLGSATPSLESLYNARRGRYRHLCLPQRVGEAVEPSVHTLDVRRRPLEEGLSAALLARMGDHLSQGGQVLLFLNRRGFAPTLICHECGWLCQCPRCDARMTLHLRRHRLLCHHCGWERVLLSACPQCGSIDLRTLGQGTERIEQVLKRSFPGIGIARIDRDATRRRGSLEALLSTVHSGESRILIGTQMLAKGHHFPDVTLVGIVDADQGLFGVDFRATERMAQLIVQVAGRAGRATKPGTVVIQTHYPDHPLWQTLIAHGYGAFAEVILQERRLAQLPPFTFQALLRAEAPVPDLPGAFLQQALETGHELVTPVELLGPVPAPMERRAGRYRAQLLAQCEQRQELHHFLARWLTRLRVLKLARRVRWSLDVDPIDLF